jgi:hypothetical protein
VGVGDRKKGAGILEVLKKAHHLDVNGDGLITEAGFKGLLDCYDAK